MSADTKQRILDVAEQLFAEHGFAGTSLRRIIADAGLTPGEVAKDVLRNVRWARTRRGEHFDPTELEILDLSPTASDPDATAPQARVPGKPQTG